MLVTLWYKILGRIIPWVHCNGASVLSDIGIEQRGNDAPFMCILKFNVQNYIEMKARCKQGTS